MNCNGKKQTGSEQGGDHRGRDAALAENQEAERNAHEAHIRVTRIQRFDARLTHPLLSPPGEKECDRERHDNSGGE
jgi:hypothetical protein